jgi:hypothetical protein
MEPFSAGLARLVTADRDMLSALCMMAEDVLDAEGAAGSEALAAAYFARLAAAPRAAKLPLLYALDYMAKRLGARFQGGFAPQLVAALPTAFSAVDAPEQQRVQRMLQTWNTDGVFTAQLPELFVQVMSRVQGGVKRERPEEEGAGVGGGGGSRWGVAAAAAAPPPPPLPPAPPRRGAGAALLASFKSSAMNAAVPFALAPAAPSPTVLGVASAPAWLRAAPVAPLRALYARQPHVCRQTGLRWERREDLERHATELAGAAQLLGHRCASWYAGADAWAAAAPREAEGGGSEAALTHFELEARKRAEAESAAAAKRLSADHDADAEASHFVPVAEAGQGVACAVCGEPLTKQFQDALDAWVYVGCLRSGDGALAHTGCLSG